MIKLFDIQNGKVIPTEHCYNLKTLSQIMEEYPQDYMKIFSYFFYMTCPDESINPMFHIPKSDKEDLILKEVEAEFSTEDEMIIQGLEFCRKLYETPTSRAYNGIATMLDRLARYMEETSIEHGRDGNLTGIINAAAKFDSIRQSYKGVYKDLQEEQKTTVRGGRNLAYDG